MHPLRDALLGSAPKGPDKINKLERSIPDRQGVLDSIAREDLKELRGAAFHNRIWIISSCFCNGDGVDSLIGYLHSL